MRTHFFGCLLVMVPGLINAEDSLKTTRAYHRVDAPQLAVSFELPADWITEVKEGTLTYHPPGAAPEVVLSIQMIDNTAGTSDLAAQVAKLKSEIGTLPQITFLADENSDFAGQPGHLLIGRFQSATGITKGMVWQIVARNHYFYWIGMTFPPDKWEDGYAVLMDRLNTGFQFTALHPESAEKADSAAAAFLQDVRQGQLDDAFARTSATFHQVTPRTEFGKFVEAQPVLSSFPWFRILENVGATEQRRLAVEFGGGSGDAAVPFAFLDLERKGPADWSIGTFYLTEGQRIPPAGAKATRAGFTGITVQKAGFSGSFPEHWIMLPEELPENIKRIVFRPPGGGLQRSHQSIIITIGRQEGPLIEGLDAYLSSFAVLPGYQRSENYESKLGALSAAGTTFRGEVEDDRGLHITASVVTALRSPGGAVAFIHVTLDSENFSTGFDRLVAPIIEDFRFIE
ncbi:MAG: hypothetical protein KA152_18115 [Verrucomicrobiales bacterium]|nr:hypothetical protein [Verrucomicrobiales bacterium]